MTTDELPTLKGIQAFRTETGAQKYQVAQPFMAIDTVSGQLINVVHADDYLELVALALRYKAALSKARRNR